MTIVKDALPILHAGRAILAAVGLRNFRVFVRVTDWSGDAAGRGTKTVTEKELTVAGGAAPEIVLLSDARVVASGGQLGDQIYEVTLTPEHTGGGTSIEDMTPPVPPGVKREVHYLVHGPGCAPGGTVCAQVSVNTSSPFRHVMRIRKTGAKK